MVLETPRKQVRNLQSSIRALNTKSQAQNLRLSLFASYRGFSRPSGGYHLFSSLHSTKVFFAYTRASNETVSAGRLSE